MHQNTHQKNINERLFFGNFETVCMPYHPQHIFAYIRLSGQKRAIEAKSAIIISSYKIPDLENPPVPTLFNLQDSI